MMGTADEIVKAPEKGPIFVEDMPEEEQVVNVVSFLYTALVASNIQFQRCVDLDVFVCVVYLVACLYQQIYTI